MNGVIFSLCEVGLRMLRRAPGMCVCFLCSESAFEILKHHVFLIRYVEWRK